MSSFAISSRHCWSLAIAPSSTRSIFVRSLTNELLNAAGLFQQAAELAGQDPLITLRARFGLGRTVLVGVENQLPGWNQADAENHFTAIVTAYNKEHSPLLAWPAASAHAYLGRLAGTMGEWKTMASECRAGIDILEDLPDQETARPWIAIYLSWAAYADQRSNNSETAGQTYRRAIELGQQAGIDPEKLQSWQSELDQLEKGTPPK